MPTVPPYYYQHLENILDRLNETNEFAEPVVQDFEGKGTVTFSPAPVPAAQEPVADPETAVDPNEPAGTGRPDRVTGGRQNRQPA